MRDPNVTTSLRPLEPVNGASGGVADRDTTRGNGTELTFGECEGLCGRMVERVGWDRYCYACQDEAREEDEEAREALRDEDEYLYTLPFDPRQIG